MASRQLDEPITLVQKNISPLTTSASARLATRIWKADLIPLGLLAFRMRGRAPRARAASCTVAISVAVWAMLAGLTKTAIETLEDHAVHQLIAFFE